MESEEASGRREETQGRGATSRSGVFPPGGRSLFALDGAGIRAVAERYDIEFVPHLIRATGGSSQPEEEKLAVWARRDCGLIAQHYGLSFPDDAGVVPEPAIAAGG